MTRSSPCSDPRLNKMWDIGWHTLRLCANETFFDCPYYEQLHYSGDDRVEVMITLTNSSDHRLVKDAILQFYYSQQPRRAEPGQVSLKHTPVYPDLLP